jgi:hypothetical protein
MGGRPLIGWLTNFEKKEKEKETSFVDAFSHFSRPFCMRQKPLKASFCLRKKQLC